MAIDYADPDYYRSISDILSNVNSKDKNLRTLINIINLK